MARGVWVALGVIACAGVVDACSSGGSGGVGGAGGNDASAMGGEGQPCYPNDTCNAGLSCLSNLCVDAGSGGTAGAAGAGGSAGSSGASGTGGTAGAAGSGGAAGAPTDAAEDSGFTPICDSGLLLPNDAADCANCLSQYCCTEFTNCTGNADPGQTQQCLNDCSVTPPGPLCVSAMECQANNCAPVCG
jgi:hypothetical protein